MAVHAELILLESPAGLGAFIFGEEVVILGQEHGELDAQVEARFLPEACKAV